MKYTLKRLNLDIDEESRYLSKMISDETSEEFYNDFAEISAKLKYDIKLSNEEKERLLTFYNRRHVPCEFVTADKLVDTIKSSVAKHYSAWKP